MSTYNFTAVIGNKHYKVKFDVSPDQEGEVVGRYGLLPYKGFVSVFVYLKGVSNAPMVSAAYCSAKEKEFNELKGCKEALSEVLHRYHFTAREKEVFWKAFMKNNDVKPCKIKIITTTIFDKKQEEEPEPLPF